MNILIVLFTVLGFFVVLGLVYALVNYIPWSYSNEKRESEAREHDK